MHLADTELGDHIGFAVHSVRLAMHYQDPDIVVQSTHESIKREPLLGGSHLTVSSSMNAKPIQYMRQFLNAAASKR